MPYMQQSTWMWYCGQKVRAVVNFSSSCSGRYVEDEWSVGSLKIHWWWLINASWRRHSSVGVQLTAFIRHRMASHWRSSAVEYGGCKNVRSPLLRIQSYESLPLFFFFLTSLVWAARDISNTLYITVGSLNICVAYRLEFSLLGSLSCIFSHL